MPFKNFRKLLVLIIMLVIVLPLLSGCGNHSDSNHEDVSFRSDLEDYLPDAAPRVKLAYQHAVDHPEDLMYQPCYCGCGAMGHTNNLDCFIKEVKDDGQIVYDNHAAGCGICVDIAQDVIRLKDEGQSDLQIRHYIDSYYSSFGPSTDTPLPEA